MKITLASDDGSWTESVVLGRDELRLADLDERLLGPGGRRLLDALRRALHVDAAETVSVLDYAQRRWESRRQSEAASGAVSGGASTVS